MIKSSSCWQDTGKEIHEDHLEFLRQQGTGGVPQNHQ
jgi:hypothetical protein